MISRFFGGCKSECCTCTDGKNCCCKASESPRRFDQNMSNFQFNPSEQFVSHPNAGMKRSDESKIFEPIVDEKIIEVYKEEYRVDTIEVPQKQYTDKIIEVPQKVIKEKIYHVPKPIIQERVQVRKKPVVEECIIDVPQCKVIDKIVDVPQYVNEHKIIKVPKIIIQERVIPVPKKTSRQIIKEIPAMNFDDVAKYVSDESSQEEKVPDQFEKVIEIPHVQHVYRNVMMPQYKHVPQGIPVTVTHYRPKPVEKIIDRSVPVPVCINICTEYLCPKIEPVYQEVPVPITVQRIIEHPVPKEAINNPNLLPLYYSNQFLDSKNKCFASCNSPNNNGSCFPGFSCWGKPYQGQLTKTMGENSVEILTQGGYPYFQNMTGTNEKNWTTIPTNQDMDNVPNETERSFMSSKMMQNPYVQVSITPQIPGEPSTVNILQADN